MMSRAQNILFIFTTPPKETKNNPLCGRPTTQKRIDSVHDCRLIGYYLFVVSTKANKILYVMAIEHALKYVYKTDNSQLMHIKI